VPEMEFDLAVNLESWANGEARARRVLRLDAKVADKKISDWKIDGREESEIPSLNNSDKSDGSNDKTAETAKLALLRNFEFRLPLSWLLAKPPSGNNSGNLGPAPIPSANKLKLRFSLWLNSLPVDALPLEGWIELELLSEAELTSAM
jgi:hypothetical protein